MAASHRSLMARGSDTTLTAVPLISGFELCNDFLKRQQLRVIKILFRLFLQLNALDDGVRKLLICFRKGFCRIRHFGLLKDRLAVPYLSRERRLNEKAPPLPAGSKLRKSAGMSGARILAIYLICAGQASADRRSNFAFPTRAT